MDKKKLFNLGTQCHKKNDLGTAQEYYNKVLDIDPNHTNALNNLGVIFFNFGENQKAINFYEKAIKINPIYLDAYNNLGVAHKKIGQLQEAKTCFKKAIEIKPDYASAHNSLGDIYRKLGENLKAKTCYDKAIEIMPNNEILYDNLGSVFINLGENQKAISCFKKSIEINPNYVNAYNNLGVTHKKMGQLQKAISFFEKVVEIDSNHLMGYINLGSSFWDMGKNQKAIDFYEKAKTLKIDNPILSYNYGVALISNKQFNRAAEQFRLINYKNSKSFLLACLYRLNHKTAFLKELDNQIKQGESNAIIGNICTGSEIKYGIKKLNPFCDKPLEYVLNSNLEERCNFKDIFIDPIKNVFRKDLISTRKQDSLTNGLQTVGNLFDQKFYFLEKIKNIIHSEIDKYYDHFKESKEGLIKNWPNSYTINAWLVSMKRGGKLDSHMHDFGWLSGSIYINIPPKQKTNSGNLVVCTDNFQQQEIQANVKRKKIIDLKTGSLCLFPSSLYHYTIPFESSEDRIVLAFDVIPNYFDK